MKITSLLVSSIMLLACASNQPGSEVQQATKVESLNLFDGHSLTGWRIFKNKENNSWEVVDGTLHCKPFADTGANFRSDLITEEQFQNFELTFEFKIAAQANSGVMFRVSEDYDQTYSTGPEYQIIDDTGYPGQLAEENKTACNYAMHVAENKVLKPIDEWNEGKIVADGNHIKHWLNGTQVVAYELYSTDWTTRKEASKWKDFPGYATVKKGHIALQDHGNEVWFRNISIKVLD
ncbi:MAG: DUF1080 domain-containing protein [Cyclobacteriaceae bacterium]|nr:DUF1080 domain-containing protein [Cyclobacteriaceae bacterium]UYN87684.1 MAG: DUF1080 domain-containing protein [Cyclobacteriaceae bacterium]